MRPCSMIKDPETFHSTSPFTSWLTGRLSLKVTMQHGQVPDLWDHVRGGVDEEHGAAHQGGPLSRPYGGGRQGEADDWHRHPVGQDPEDGAWS